MAPVVEFRKQINNKREQSSVFSTLTKPATSSKAFNASCLRTQQCEMCLCSINRPDRAHYIGRHAVSSAIMLAAHT